MTWKTGGCQTSACIAVSHPNICWTVQVVVTYTWIIDFFFFFQNKDLPLENTTDCLSTMARICRVMIENP